MRIRAHLISLGGGIVLAMAIVISCLTIGAFVIFSSLALRLVALVFSIAIWTYFFDAWSEVLWITDGTLWFDSVLKRQRRVDFSSATSVLLVHEGLNPERGIDSLIVRDAGGELARFSLGPLWRRHELEMFLRELEQSVGKTKLVETVR